MVQVVIFITAFGILVANGTGILGSFLGAVAISFVGSLIFLGLIVKLFDK